MGVIVLLILGGLLGLDLRNRGLAWQLFWSLTGEEEPFSQARGMIEWAGNFIRPQPNTAPDVPVAHADINPYGINTFLQQEVEIAKREKTLQMIAEAGFTMLRQQFPWADIEVDGRGQYTDSRNDLNGDGTPDTIDAWAKYDNIVELAEKYHLALQVRLDSPPGWSRANPESGDFGPPDDVQDFVNFVTAVATRYKDRIRYYQIWNEPNIFPEWGNQPVNPEAYTDLLCRTYQALKAVDPEIVVIAGALSPTIALTPENLNDFIFLQRMYQAGAGACFDVMAAQGYGFYSGPTDRRLRPLTLNFGRIQYLRDLMVLNGDAGKALWISEAAWNAQPEDPMLVTSQYGNFGIVTEEQAAQYMPLAYQRAQEEWPWLGNIAYWFFKRPADYERNQAFYYFRMVEPDFTPLPVYAAMKQYITTQKPILYPGVHQAEDWRVNLPSNTWFEANSAAQGGRDVRTMEADFIVHGTDVIVRWQGYAAFRVWVDDNPQPLTVEVRPMDENFFETTIFRSLTPETHRIRIDGVYDGLRFKLDSITIADRSYANLFPYAAAVLIALLLPLWIIGCALGERGRNAQQA